MTADKIITLPHPSLRERSRRIGHVDASVRALAERMIAASLDWESTREHESTAALAAVQINELYRVVVIRDDFERKERKSFTVLINPEITRAEGDPVEDMEGCLSVKDVYGSVARYPKVKVKALNLEGKEIRLTAEGFLARVIQHEIDHTNGIVFVDRIEDPAKLYRLLPSGEFLPLKPEEAPARRNS